MKFDNSKNKFDNEALNALMTSTQLAVSSGKLSAGQILNTQISDETFGTEEFTESTSTLEIFDAIESNLQVLRELQGRVSFLGREIRYLLKVRD